MYSQVQVYVYTVLSQPLVYRISYHTIEQVYRTVQAYRILRVHRKLSLTCLHKLCMLEELLAVNSWPPDFIPPASDLYER